MTIEPGAASALDAISTLDALEVLAFALVSLTSRAIALEAGPRELTFQQWRALVVLGEATEGLRVTDLGRRIAASGPSTSRIARRLADHGLVEVTPDPRDRRAIRIRLSAAGSGLRNRIVTRRRELIRGAIGETTAGQPVPAGAAALVEALGRVI